MTSNNTKPYSQAFNFGGLIQPGIDNRTGQYSCSVPLYQAPTDAPNWPAFKLCLNYNVLGTRDIGFGHGWEFNLSRYNHRQSHTLCLMTGEQYQIYDSPNSVTVKDQKLSSFRFEKHGSYYHIIYKSGQREILSNLDDIYSMSVPVEIIAPSGRCLKLTWVPVASVPRLSKVGDGVQDLLTIEYGSGIAKVTCSPGTPQSATFVLTQMAENLSKVTLPGGGGVWEFQYQKINDHNLITQVTSPTGLREDMHYKPEGHQLPLGAPIRTMPHILRHIVFPGKGQPPTKTFYTFSSQNFLGHGGVNHWSDSEDNLYRLPSFYNYSCTSQVEGGVSTTYTYNNYHLLLRLKCQNGTKCLEQVMTYHFHEDIEFQQQPGQCQLPKTKTTIYGDLDKAGSIEMEMTLYSFDIWGNPTEILEPNGFKTQWDYFPAEGEPDICPPDPYGFVRYTRTEVKTHKSGGPSTSKRFKYIALPGIKSSSVLTGSNGPHYFIALEEPVLLMDDNHPISKKYSYINNPDSIDPVPVIRAYTDERIRL